MGVVVVVVFVVVVVVVVVVIVLMAMAVIVLTLQAEQQRSGHLTPLHGQHHHTGTQTGRELLLEMLQPLGGKPVGAAHQHQIRRIELILEQRLQIAEVIEAGVR
jgi:hypothetical protein